MGFFEVIRFIILGSQVGYFIVTLKKVCYDQFYILRVGKEQLFEILW